MIGRTLLRTCADLGIEVALVDGRLVIDAPEGEQADEVLAMVARLRDEVVHALEGPSTATPWQRFVALTELDRAERRAGR